MVIILDTRFLIAHTFPPSEEDREAILRFLRRYSREALVIPTVVVSEFVRVAGKRLGRETAKVRMRAWLSSSKVKLADLDLETAEMSGEISLEHDVPLADAVVASTARRLGGAVATDDEHFKRMRVRTVWYK